MKTEINVDFGTISFKIKLECPSNMSEEKLYYEYIKNSNIETIEEALIKAVSVEMVKIIKCIEIDQEEPIIINMDEINSVKQKISVLEKLPAKVTQSIRE